MGHVPSSRFQSLHPQILEFSTSLENLGDVCGKSSSSSKWFLQLQIFVATSYKLSYEVASLASTMAGYLAIFGHMEFWVKTEVYMVPL